MPPRDINDRLRCQRTALVAAYPVREHQQVRVRATEHRRAVLLLFAPADVLDARGFVFKHHKVPEVVAHPEPSKQSVDNHNTPAVAYAVPRHSRTPTMQYDEFEGYLRALPELGDRAVGDCLSRCKRLEKHEGDLDAHFDDDRMEDLIDRLAYSAEDERRGRQPRHKVPIDGNQRKGSDSLKRAARRYRDFRAGI